MLRLASCSTVLLFVLACSSTNDADPAPDGGDPTIDSAPPAAAGGTLLDRAPASDTFRGTLDVARNLQQFEDGVRVGLTGAPVVPGTVLRGQLDGNLAITTMPYNTQVATPPRYCRYDVSTGQPDATFGVGGCVSAPRAYFSTSGIAKVPGGYRAIVQRSCTNGCTTAERSFGLVKFSADGVLDTTFGTEGILYSTILPELDAIAFAAQTSGDLVITGYTGLYNMKLFRIHADGSLDTAFGTDGFVPGANGGRIRVLADDTILVESTYNGTERLDHYTKDGAVIASIELEAITHSTFDNNMNQTAADVDASGNIVVGYTRSDTDDGPEHHQVMRILATGEIDPAFESPNLGDGDGNWIFGIGFETDGRVIVGVGYNDVAHLQP